MLGSNYILVTGGAGFIGSHTCKALASSGYIPVTFDNLSNGNRHSVKWGPFIEGDICNRSDINKAFNSYNYEAVIHFSGLIDVAESNIKPELYYKNNVLGSLNLFEAMQTSNVKKIIFSSSCAVYGEVETVPITENTHQRPISPYAKSKFMVEHMLQDFGLAHGLRYVICRYFNACGADLQGEIGEEHDPETHLIPNIIQTILGQHPFFSILGTDYATRDGTCVRDYIHVSDLAEAHIKSLDYLNKGHENTDFNLGSGKGYSVREIVDAIQMLTNKKIIIKEEPRRAGDPPILIADSKKCIEELKFKPQMSDLDTILSSSLNFYLNYKE